MATRSALADVAPDATLLDFLRLRRSAARHQGGLRGGRLRRLHGAGRPAVVRGELVYESVNACIRFVGSLDGCHVVTVEHLAGKDGDLHPVQQAMVDFHGSQCGFCTPGFVMSLYGLWMTSPQPVRCRDREGAAGQSVPLHRL